jgi:hypothetical protein
MSGRSDATLGNGGRGINLPQWLPTQLNKGLSRSGVGCTEIEDIGQDDKDRIAPLDVFGRLPRTSERVSEQHAVTGSDRLAGGQAHNRPATATTFDFRDPRFARREGVHQRLLTRHGDAIGDLDIAQVAGGCLHNDEMAGKQTEQRRSVWSSPTDSGISHDRQARVPQTGFTSLPGSNPPANRSPVVQ